MSEPADAEEFPRGQPAVSLFPIYLVNFIATLGFSIVLPFLVTLVNKLGGNALVYGLMGATYSAFQLVGAPVLGRWSDVRGRRSILLLSQLGTLLSWIVFLLGTFIPPHPLLALDLSWTGSFAVTVPLVLLFAARALDGLTGGNVSVANAYLADLTEEKDRNRNFGRMAVAGNLGFIVGPILSGLLGSTSYEETIPVLAAVTISLVASLLIGFYLPESNPCVLRKNPEQSNVRKVFGQEQADCFALEKQISFRDVWRLPRIPILLFLYFVIFLGFNLFYTAFPVHALRGLSWSITDIGFFFSFLGLTTVLVQGPLLSRLTGRYPDGALALLGSLILGTAFLLFVTGQTGFLYLGATFFSLGNGLLWPSFLSILSRAAGETYQGSVQGVGSSVGSLASILGLIVGGILYELIGGLTFLMPAALIYLVFLLGTRFLLGRRAS